MIMAMVLNITVLRMKIISMITAVILKIMVIMILVSILAVDTKKIVILFIMLLHNDSNTISVFVDICKYINAYLSLCY